MSQQQFYAPQPGQQAYPPQPMQQPYAPQPPQQYAPAQPGYQQQMPPQAFPAQGYAPQVPQQPAVPLADGSLDAFYNQPNTGGGPGVSWKGKPDGYTIQGVVPRDVTNADVTQEVGAPNTQQAGQPQFYRDGRPKFVMAVPLQVPQSPEYPEGEARLFVRGQLRDELSRAMTVAGVTGAPTAGSVITVTLVERKQGRGAIPQNVFHVTYTPAGAPAPAIQQPVNQPQPVQQQYAPAPAQQFAPQATPQQYAQPVVPQQVPQAAPVQHQYAAAPAPQVAQAAPVQQAPVAQAPVQQQPLQPVAGMTDQQAELLAKLTGGQPQAPQG
jgi:hypothetical protein